MDKIDATFRQAKGAKMAPARMLPTTRPHVSNTELLMQIWSAIRADTAARSTNDVAWQRDTKLHLFELIVLAEKRKLTPQDLQACRDTVPTLV